MKRSPLALLALVLLVATVPLPAHSAQPYVYSQATLVRNEDITSAGYTYYAYGDFNPAVAGVPVEGVWTDGRAATHTNKAKTTGSSTTVESNTASAGVFRFNVVGDLLIFPRVVLPIAAGGTRQPQLIRFERKITAKATDDSITVDEAIDLSSGGGFEFRFKKLLSGTAATDGWFPVRGIDHFNVQFDVTTINATSLTATLECKVTPYARANTMHEEAFTAAGAKAVSVSTAQDQCRIGWKVAGDAGAQSVSAAVMEVR